ncbi:MAG: glycosyltransferase [Acidimicrobiales bacterium]
MSGTSGLDRTFGSITAHPLTVSVVICAYTERRWDMLERAVDSVLEQSYPAAELIVCIDHNVELAEKCRRSWGDPAGGSSIPIFILENKYEGRLGSARNTAVEQASGEIVAFLDDDASAHRDWLALLTAPYQKEEVVAVGGAPVPVFETSRPAWFPPQLDWVFGCYYDGLPSALSPVDRLIGASMSARRDALDAIGGFHSDNHDDMDMCLRLAHQRGRESIVMEPRAVVYHNVGAERVTWNYLWRRCFFVNKGKVKAFRDMGSAASMKADVKFVTGAIRRSAVQCVRDLMRGDVKGLSRLTVLVVSLLLAASGNIAGQISNMSIFRGSTDLSGQTGV